MDDTEKTAFIMKNPLIITCVELRERMIENGEKEDYISFEFSDVVFTLKVEAKEDNLKSIREELYNA